MGSDTHETRTALSISALTTALLLGAGPACDCAGGAGADADAAAGDAGPRADASGVADAVSVQLLAFNDFHGELRSSGTWETLNGPVPAGGAVYLATHVAMRRAENPNTVVVSAGDLIGASPLLSGRYHDEPTVEVMNLLGLDINTPWATASSTRTWTSCCAAGRGGSGDGPEGQPRVPTNIQVTINRPWRTCMRHVRGEHRHLAGYQARPMSKPCRIGAVCTCWSDLPACEPTLCG